jgi:hypothetical protein
MRMQGMLLILLYLTSTAPVSAEQWFWKDALGHPVPDTPSRRSSNGVGGWLLVTSDDNWKEKWNTPSATVPQFTEAHTVVVGQRLHILTFVANPPRSTDGHVNLTCDLSMQRPDGTFSMQRQDMECLTGSVVGKPSTLYLTSLVIGFFGEKSDPAGTWIVRVTLNDKIQHLAIPLENSFTLH